jgi:hypothetical protein
MLSVRWVLSTVDEGTAQSYTPKEEIVMGKFIDSGIVVLAVALICMSEHAAAEFDQQREVDYPNDGVVLGNGWSTLTASKAPGSCIEFQEAQDLAEDRTLDLKRVVDKYQLNRDLNISAEFQAKAIIGVGGSAKASYAKSLEMKQDSLSLVLAARVIQGAKFAVPKSNLQSVRLTPSAERLAKNNMSDFVRQCGDSYVSAIHSGGEMNAQLNFDAASMDEKEAITASMSVSALSFSGSASMNQTMRQYREQNKLRILMHAAGGTGVPIPVNETELLDRLRNLPLDVKSAPKAYRISVTKYSILPNWPGGDIQGLKYSDMERLVAQYQRYNSLYFDTYSVLQRPDSYIFRGEITLDSVRALQDKLRTVVLPKLVGSIKSLINGEAFSFPAEAADLDYELRKMMPVTKSSFAEDIQLAQIDARVASASAALAATPNTKTVRILGNRIDLPNPNKALRAKELKDAQVALSKARSAYASSLANAMYKQWIEMPSYYRCLDDSIGDYCLSQAQLAAYKVDIAARVGQ